MMGDNMILNMKRIQESTATFHINMDALEV